MNELEMVKQSETIFAEVKDLGRIQTIKTPDEYSEINEAQSRRKKAIKLIDNLFDPHIAQLYQAHKSGVSLKKKFSDPLLALVKEDDQKMMSFREVQRRIAAKKEEELQAAARRKAEDEQLALAEALHRDGQTEEAEMVIQEETVVPTVIVPPEIPKSDELKFTRYWKFRVVNKDQVPRDFLTVDEVKLGQYARMQKENAKISGVEFFYTESSSSK